MKRLLINLFITVIVFPASCFAEEVTKIGTVYPIAERSGYEELLDKVRNTDFNKYFNSQNMNNILDKANFYNNAHAKLPRATVDRVFYTDMTYTLPFDITDSNGNIKYQKGSAYNPADYVFLPNILVFIDAADIAQVHWFKTSPYFKDQRVMLNLTNGSYQKASKELLRPVFYAGKVMIERFNIQKLPSVIVQKGNVMEVSEIAIKTK